MKIKPLHNKFRDRHGQHNTTESLRTKLHIFNPATPMHIPTMTRTGNPSSFEVDDLESSVLELAPRPICPKSLPTLSPSPHRTVAEHSSLDNPSGAGFIPAT